MLALNNKLQKEFDTFFTETLEGGVLSDRDRILVILATALVMEDANTLKNAVLTAKQLGFTNEELGHISAIVIAMRGQKINGLVSFNVSTATNKSSKCCE
ncbi:carboxymuconolactone decarboxylase family protein [Geobacillus sp. C56-T3]|uniref:carboxymuconolactone decarboxylase family protein n=1 Tax=Geobacillus sp. (strain C56-T3) TaxID=691437 RepID=UPI0001D5847F|nr:carboxymuconolactone decarboxylase family protein [Geobacillus sp. C56-T3]ADI26182.1 carboxymuconolactone decarboxylase family [Geobacillus sp. C56-T3]